MTILEVAALWAFAGAGVALAQPTDDAPEAQPALVPPVLLTYEDVPWPVEVSDFTPRTVQLLLLVDEAGAVESVTLLAGEEPFATLAAAAAGRMTFEPAREGAVAVAVELPFSWEFVPPVENVRGRARLRGVAEPLVGARILLGDREAFTDADGAFAFRGVPPGDWQVVLGEPGLQMDPARFVLTGDVGEVVELDLWALQLSAEAVGVYSRRREQGVVRTLTDLEVRTTPGTLGDPVRAVQNLPGVVRTPADAGWLLVRGGDPEDTGLFIDGTRVPLVYHLGGFTSVLHPGMIDKVVFLPGGFGVRYGGATAGVVDLESDPANDERRVEVGADLIQAGAYLELALGQEKKHGFAVAARRSYLDGILASLPGVTEEQSAIAPRFWDWQARWSAPAGGLFTFGYSDTVDAPTGVGDETVTVTLGTSQVHGRWDAGTALGTVRLVPTVGWEWRDFAFDGREESRDRYQAGLRLERLDDGEGAWGVMAGFDGFAGLYRLSVDGLATEAWFGSVDPYAQVRVGSLDEGPHLLLGLRAETLQVEGQRLRARPSPRGQAAVPIPGVDGLLLAATLGLYHQAPPMDTLIGFPSGPYLLLEQAWGPGLGLRWAGQLATVQASAEVDGYYRYQAHVTLIEDDGTLGQGAGQAYGVEALVRYQRSRVRGWTSYTWSRSTRQIETGDPFDANRYDQPQSLTTVLAYDLPKGWSFGGRFRYAQGTPRNFDEGTVYDILTSQTADLDAFTLDDGRLVPFHALDLKVSREATFRRWQLDFYLDVQNVYWRRIPEPVINGIDDSEVVYGFGMPTLPIVGVKGVFFP